MSSKIQIVKCPCNKVFAACVEPECYTDIDWQRNLRGYVSKGCKPEMINSGSLKFDQCTCENFKPEDKSQLSLF